MASENAVLSQREIDALLTADVSQLESDAVVALPPPARKDAGKRVKLYDFRHPEKLSKEQIRGLQIIQQGWAGGLPRTSRGGCGRRSKRA